MHGIAYLCSEGTPWARATKNVKKPQSQICESCLISNFCKAWLSGLHLGLNSGVQVSNPIAAPKSYDVYPSTSGLLLFTVQPETVLWNIAKILLLYYYY